MPGRILIGTNNPDKVIEMRHALADLDVELVDLSLFPDISEPVEDGLTLAENARKKALHFARHAGLMALSDDTGLSVAALGGEPGVYSARYAGPNATYEDNCRKLLEEMKDVPEAERQARFCCVIVLAVGERILLEVEGVCEGVITTKPCGDNGFGYDPVFFVPGQGMTFAEMDLDLKNRLSHRARALAKLATGLQTGLDALNS